MYPAALTFPVDGWGLPWFAVLGLAGGLMAVFLSRAIYLIEEAFERLPIHWMWWPALGGTVVGLVGVVFPQALGVGAEHLQMMVLGKATFAFLAAMLVCKTVAWSVSLGSGTSGGVLGPLLLMGGSLGGVLAWLVGHALPAAPDPGLWVIVAMAAVFCGATRTPLTSVVFALELTHQVDVLLPALIACAVSDLVSLGLLKHSIMTEKIARRGMPIVHEYELDVLAMQTVGQVMTDVVETVPESMPVRELCDLFYAGRRSKHQGYPVMDARGQLVGMVTRSDLAGCALRQHDLDWLRVADVMGSRVVIVARQDERLRDAAERMLAAGVGRLPVVAADAPDHLIGILSRSDVLKALAHRAEEEHCRERLLGKAW
jgi:CBS domain-containing protein